MFSFHSHSYWADVLSTKWTVLFFVLTKYAHVHSEKKERTQKKKTYNKEAPTTKTLKTPTTTAAIHVEILYEK